MDEDGNEPIHMRVDEVAYPLDNITDFDSYSALKPPEKAVKPQRVVKDEEGLPPALTRKIHRGNDIKEIFFFQVYEKGLTAGAAAKLLNIPRRTGYNWLKEDQIQIQSRFDGRDDDNKNEPKKKPGRKALLHEEHKHFLEQKFDDNPSTTIEQATDDLCQQFENLKVAPTTVYKFMRKNCALSLKKAYRYPAQRNAPEKIQERYDWVVRWPETDMDYESNCIFIDESAFHINLKRTMAWSKVGERAIIETPQTKAKTITILGAISPFGVVNVKVRRPYEVSSKKRKLPGKAQASSSQAVKTTGTVAGHYFNFVASTIDVLDQHEEFKDSYILMDNCPIHNSNDISRYVAKRGYRCVYLPPYTPELNPIEQFWSVVKSKLKTEKLLLTETLTSRISAACNDVLYSDLRGFCHYSHEKWQVCFDKQPL